MLVGPLNGGHMYLAHHHDGFNNEGYYQSIWVDKNIYDTIRDNELLPSDKEDYLENPDRLGKYYNIEPLVDIDNTLFAHIYNLVGDGSLPILPLYDMPGDTPEEAYDERVLEEYNKFEQNPALYRAAMKKYRGKVRKYH
jgi:hypothetical protein